MVNFFGFLIIITFIAFIVFLIAWIVSKISKKSNFAKGKYVVISFFVPIVAFILFGIATSNDPEYNSDSSSSSKTSSKTSTTKKTYRIIHTDDNVYSDRLSFDTNSNGDFTLKIKGLYSGKITLSPQDSSDKKVFKKQTVNLKKGQTYQKNIHLDKNTPALDLEIEDSNVHSDDVEITNDSKAYDQASSASESESKSAEASSNAASLAEHESVTFDEIARNPKQYKGEKVKLTGQVMQVQNVSNGSVVLLWMNDDPDQLAMVGINKDYMPDNGNILEDDEITIYGVGDGTQKYDTTSGAKNEVPFVKADANTIDAGKSNSAY